MRIDVGVPPAKGMILGPIARGVEARLRPFLASDPTEETVDGAVYRVLSLEIPEGAGAEMPVGMWGTVGLGVEAGTAYIDAPMLAGAVLRTAARGFLTRSRVVDGNLRMLLSLPKGGHMIVPIGTQATLMLRLPAA